MSLIYANIPNTFKSQITKTMMTTMFSKFLILASIGMYALISHNNTPAITIAMIIPRSDMHCLRHF